MGTSKDICNLNNSVRVISLKNREITFAILSSKHWIEAMRMSTNDGITPMRLMIMSMPGYFKSNQAIAS